MGELTQNITRLLELKDRRIEELLDENDRLTSKLALANRALEESNQSITELDAKIVDAEELHWEYIKRIAELEAEVERLRNGAADYYDCAKVRDERIAQLEAELACLREQRCYNFLRITQLEAALLLLKPMLTPFIDTFIDKAWPGTKELLKMRDIIDAALKNQLEESLELHKNYGPMQAHIAELEEALQFYADPDTYEQVDILGACPLSSDYDGYVESYGRRARSILKINTVKEGEDTCEKF